MSPRYVFMTGANFYRCEARSIEDALRTAIEQLQPDEDAKFLIQSTLREETDGPPLIYDDGGPDSGDA